MNHESWQPSPHINHHERKDRQKGKYLQYLFTGRVTCIQVPVRNTLNTTEKIDEKAMATTTKFALFTSPIAAR
jgi:hypothetical protein